MRQTQLRILCIDSSDSRRNKLAVVLQDAGFDVWTARSIGDALLMADVLRPAAILADRPSAVSHRAEWEKFKDMFPRVPVLVHSAAPNMAALCLEENEFAAVRSGDLETVTAILTAVVCPSDWTPAGTSVVHAA